MKLLQKNMTKLHLQHRNISKYLTKYFTLIVRTINSRNFYETFRDIINYWFSSCNTYNIIKNLQRISKYHDTRGDNDNDKNPPAIQRASIIDRFLLGNTRHLYVYVK